MSYGKVAATDQNQQEAYGRERQAEKQQHLAYISHKIILKGKGLHRVKAFMQVSVKT